MKMPKIAIFDFDEKEIDEVRKSSRKVSMPSTLNEVKGKAVEVDMYEGETTIDPEEEYDIIFRRPKPQKRIVLTVFGCYLKLIN